MLCTKTLTLRSVRAFFAVAILAPMLLVSQSVLAQDKKKDVIIDVKDGKVFVNGEMVKELADKDLPIIFRYDGEDTNFITLGNGDSNRPRSFSFYSDDDDDARIWSRGAENLFELKNDDGDVHVFGSFPDSRLRYQVERNINGMRGSLNLLREGDLNSFYFSEGSREIKDMEMKSHKLARKISSADEADKAELKAELDDLLDQIFDRKLEVQQDRVNKMTEELQKLRSRVDGRRSSREEIIRRRLRELLGERDTFDW